MVDRARIQSSLFGPVGNRGLLRVLICMCLKRGVWPEEFFFRPTPRVFIKESLSYWWLFKICDSEFDNFLKMSEEILPTPQ